MLILVYWPLCLIPLTEHLSTEHPLLKVTHTKLLFNNCKPLRLSIKVPLIRYSENIARLSGSNFLVMQQLLVFKKLVTCVHNASLEEHISIADRDKQKPRPAMFDVYIYMYIRCDVQNGATPTRLPDFKWRAYRQAYRRFKVGSAFMSVHNTLESEIEMDSDNSQPLLLLPKK